MEDALADRSKELQRAQHQLEKLFEISRQISAKNALSEIIDCVCEIVQEIFPNSVPLMFLLDAASGNFLSLKGCSTAVLEPLLKAYGEIERSELIPDFIRYLQSIQESQLDGFDNYGIEVWEGIPYVEILKFAREKNCDLIIQLTN